MIYKVDSVIQPLNYRSQENNIADWRVYTVIAVGINLCTAIYIVQGITSEQRQHNPQQANVTEDFPTNQRVPSSTSSKQHENSATPTVTVV